MKFLHCFLTSTVVASCFALSAAEDLTPDVFLPSKTQDMVVSALSDNGRYALSQTEGESDELTEPLPQGGTIIDLSDRSLHPIYLAAGAWASISDVSDDGIVAGSYNGKPAIYDLKNDKWTTFTVPLKYQGGQLSAITPDGRYGAGYFTTSSEWNVYPALYDLTTGQRISTPNLPSLDMAHENHDQMRFTGISPDGRYLLGVMSESYWLPVGVFHFIYDLQTESYTPIGWTENKTSAWTPLYQGIHMMPFTHMSPNGEWVGGMVYMENFVGDYDYSVFVPFRYNVLTQAFDVYDSEDAQDAAGLSTANDGTMMCATPAMNPYSTMMVRCGNYFVTLDDIFKQIYNIDLPQLIGDAGDNTGRPVAVSGDGRTMVLITSPTQSYILQLKEDITEAAARVDLLGNYTPSPSNGSVMSTISTVKITFSRKIKFTGNAARIKIYDQDGNAVTNGAALQAKAENSTLTLNFKTFTMDQGKTYTIRIPAGMISLPADAEVSNRPIEIQYIGRGTGAVKPTRMSPANNSTVARIDASSNPVVITYDAQLTSVTDAPLAYLYIEGEESPVCSLNTTANENRLYIYPLTTQYLFAGIDYRVEVPAGVVTDLSGAGANEAMTLHYTGSYVREWSTDDKYLFNEDCSQYINFMFYDGDNLEPGSVPASWGMVKGQPWQIVRENSETTDMAMAASSMYTPAGKADDWMVLPQIYIPDDKCYFSIDAQSYLVSKQDYLKVYIVPEEKVYNVLNETIIDTFRNPEYLVLNKLLSPGASEENLSDDWENIIIPLDEYAGKSIYICIVNDNEDQSAIFVDNVQVIHDLLFLTTFEHPTRVVAKDGITVRGSISIATPLATYSTVLMKLKDANGNIVSTLSETGLSLKQNDIYRFSFPDELPLVPASSNKFSVEINLDDDMSVINGQVLNLAFEPAHRIVLEEYSGAECGNCPQGFQAAANLERLYPDNALMIVLRTYQGDYEGRGVRGYSSFLGMDYAAAPSARINRDETFYFPMLYSDNHYLFSAEGYNTEPTWLDVFRDELANTPEMDINVSVDYNKDAGSFTANCVVRSATNTSNRSLNIFAVVTENQVETDQENYFYMVNDSNIGDFGVGGQYAQSHISEIYIDDVARLAIGDTYNGTGGLVPSTLVGGQEYAAKISSSMPVALDDPNNTYLTVMLIDANTNRVINAARCPIARSGVDNILADSNALNVSSVGSIITATGEGTVGVAAFTASGSMLASASGNGTATLNLTGYSGIVIVKATAGSASKVEKLNLR